jgi:hypothetical protein
MNLHKSSGTVLGRIFLLMTRGVECKCLAVLGLALVMVMRHFAMQSKWEGVRS